MLKNIFRASSNVAIFVVVLLLLVFPNNPSPKVCVDPKNSSDSLNPLKPFGCFYTSAKAVSSAMKVIRS